MDPTHDSRPAATRTARIVVATVVAGALVVAGAVVITLLAVAARSPEPGPATSTMAASEEGYTVWERNDDGLPVRWDACSRIELLVAPQHAPPGARADLHDAVAILREASGLDIVVAGESDERPRGGRLPFQPEHHGQRWAPVLVAWASPGENDLPLRDIDRGVAIPLAVGEPGMRTYVSGQVVLNADRHDLASGGGDRAHAWEATLLHELMHLLGLGHVEDPEQLMYVHPGAGPAMLGDGDVAGLRAVGAGSGCSPVPTPRAVEVVGSTGG